MARVLEGIGKEKARHIVTLEDPVEYVLSAGKSLVRQREIGRDAVSFAEGVRESLREDPDVIAVGEMRDRETIAAALTAAETGHLVLGTLHNGRALEAVGRMVHVFPAEEQSEVRLIISSVLRCVSAQRLWRMGTKTVLLREILTNTPAVANLIREGKEAQVLSYMETGVNDMRTLRQAAYKVKGVTEKKNEKNFYIWRESKMEFLYKAYADSGEVEEGRVAAAGKREAADELRSRGLHPMTIRKTGEKKKVSLFKRRRLADLAEEWESLLSAGIPVTETLDILGGGRSGKEKDSSGRDQGDHRSRAFHCGKFCGIPCVSAFFYCPFAGRRAVGNDSGTAPPGRRVLSQGRRIYCWYEIGAFLSCFCSLFFLSCICIDPYCHPAVLCRAF